MINFLKHDDMEYLLDKFDDVTTKANDYIVAGKTKQGLDFLLESVKVSNILNRNHSQFYKGHYPFMQEVAQTQLMFTDNPEGYTHKIWYELKKYQ